MTREEFQELNIDEKVKFFNNEKEKGKSGSKVCKELGISKSIFHTFGKNGYVLVNDKYIKQDIQTTFVEEVGAEEDTNISPIELNVVESHYTQNKLIRKATTKEEQLNYIDRLLDDAKQKQLEKVKVVEEKKPQGRPPKDNRSKRTINVDDKIFTEMQVFALLNKISVSDILEALARDFLEKNK